MGPSASFPKLASRRLFSNSRTTVFNELKRTDSPAAAENARRADYNNTGRVRCYNCGQVGHISYDCNIPQVRKACYLCGNSGHISRDW